MTLRRVARSDDRAPDYRIDASGCVNFGYGWSQKGAKSSIFYIAIIVEQAPGMQISGVAWHSPEHEGRWFAQFQSVSAVNLHS